MDELFLLLFPTWETVMTSLPPWRPVVKRACVFSCCFPLDTPPTRDMRWALLFPPVMCHVAHCPHGPSVLLLVAEQHPLVCVQHVFLPWSSMETRFGGFHPRPP